MVDLVSIFNLMNRYTINNGDVYLKESNEKVYDIDIVTQVKLAYFVYNKARNLYKDELMKTKRTDKNLKYYLDLVIEKICSNDRVLESESERIK